MGKKFFHEVLTLEEAVRVLLENFKKKVSIPLPGEKVFVKDSLDRITAEPIFAKFSSPYFHSAAMDGYAVRSKDTFLASEKNPVKLKLGDQAVWIETGDPLPDEFDAVIPVEEVNLKDGYIEIYQAYPPYHDVRPVGEDIVATEMIIPENYPIRPFEIGAMLASGITEIFVRRKPKVGIIPTGSELLNIDEISLERLKPPFLIEYNSHVLRGLLEKDGANPLVYPIVKDDEIQIKQMVEKALRECDMVLINAGSGYGKEDLTYKVISELGEVIINGVAIKPGKPFIAGFCADKPVLGIPGYPVSAIFCYQLFVRPLISLYLGVELGVEEKITGILSRQIASTIGVDEFVRVKVGKVGDRYIVSPMGRGAGLLMSVVRADGYIKISSQVEALSKGKEIEVFLWKSKKDIENTIVCIGSHDNTLDLIYNYLKKKYPHVSLSSAHVGSMGGLIAIKRGEAHIAGTHLLDEQTGEYNVPFIKKILPEKSIVLVNLVYRIQGLIVKKGNPKNIKGFEDLARDDVVFINRQAGSGTRLLLDKNLKELGIDPSKIRGYENEEYTHMGVAQAVASGKADVGLGIFASAKALDLDFIPVAEERYDIVIPKEFLKLEIIQAFLDVINNDKEFKEAVLSLGGYDVRDMGKIMFET